VSSDIRKELVKLRNRVLFLGSAVETNLGKAIRALLDTDAVLASEVKKQDSEIDSIEVSLEDQCLQVLALHQPVAGDLRFLVTILKINIDLERIGDLAVKIADKVLLITRSGQPQNRLNELPHIQEKLMNMVDYTNWMLTNSLNAFAGEDDELAFKVILTDDEVDRAKNTIRAFLEENVQKNSDKYAYLALLLSVSRSLERIADHCTNICEDIIYMLKGKIVRHVIDNPGDTTSQSPDGESFAEKKHTHS
jgi:phosphate transport system protein